VLEIAGQAPTLAPAQLVNARAHRLPDRGEDAAVLAG
jgi:hypothetical protein